MKQGPKKFRTIKLYFKTISNSLLKRLRINFTDTKPGKKLHKNTSQNEKIKYFLSK